MAVTSGSIQRRMKAAASLGYYGSPLTLHGYLTVSASMSEGDVLINTAGALAKAADDPTHVTVVGVLGAIAPTVGTQRPLTTAALPAASLPRQRTTTATVGDRTKYDDDKSVAFFPWVPGNIFEGHLTTAADTDETADSNLDVYVGVGFNLHTSPAAGRFTFGLSSGATKLAGRSLGFVNPQLTTVASSVIILSPGPVVDNVGGTAGTKNPLITVLPMAGLLSAVT